MKTSILVAGLAGTFGLSTLAAAADYSFKMHGETATATGSRSTECGYLVVNMNGSRSRTRAGDGEPERIDSVVVDVWYQDICTGWFLTAQTEIEGGYDGNLDSAVMEASLDGTRYRVNPETGGIEYGEPAVIDIIADLTGVGEIEQGSYLEVVRQPAFYSKTRSKGKTREAMLEMSVMIDGEDIELDYTVGTLGHTNATQRVVTPD